MNKEELHGIIGKAEQRVWHDLQMVGNEDSSHKVLNSVGMLLSYLYGATSPDDEKETPIFKPVLNTGKIKFDIKYKKDIEEGKYSIVTKEGRSARIVCWDANSSKPIIALVLYESGELPISYYLNGEACAKIRYTNFSDVDDLYLIRRDD